MLGLPSAAAATPVYTSSFGSRGPASGEFIVPTGVAVDPALQALYVVDQYRVERFDYHGNYVLQWGSYGSGPGQFSGASWIATDPSTHHVYVVDGQNGDDRVEIFDSSGNYLGQFGSYGVDNGEFSSVAGIAVDSSDHYVYVVDNVPGGDGRVEIFGSAGNYVGQFVVHGSPNDVAVDPSNHYTYVVTDTTSVQVFNPQGIYAGQFGSSQLSKGEGIAIDPASHDVYVVDAARYALLQFTGAGSFLSAVGSVGSGAGQFEGPVGVVADPSGLIYVTDTSGTRVEIWYQQPSGGGGGGGGGGGIQCRVPRVIGRRLRAAKAAVKAAHCAVGKITHHKSKRGRRGRVIRQSIGPGTVRAAGTKVNLVVGR